VQACVQWPLVSNDLVPYGDRTFTACVKMGIKVGLPRDYNSHHRIVLPNYLLWILLFPAFAENILDNGGAPDIFPNSRFLPSGLSLHLLRSTINSRLLLGGISFTDLI
jgi:hypothetical protein